MKRYLFLSIVALALRAQTLPEVIEAAYRNDPEIKMLKAEIKLQKSRIEAASLWENPRLRAGMSDVRTDDPLNRSIEPMQTQFLALSQTIPLSDRYGAERKRAQKIYDALRAKLEDQKRKIASQLAGYAYDIVVIHKRIRLIEKNKRNLRRIKNLLMGYRASGDLLLETDQMLQRLNVRKEALKMQERIRYSQIRRHTLRQIDEISASITLPEEIPDSFDQEHPALRLYRYRIEAAREAVAAASMRERPDLTVSGGYYQRAGRADYLNVSVSMPLQVRGREKIATQQAKIDLTYQIERLALQKAQMQNAFETLRLQYMRDKKNYLVYQQRILPLQRKIRRYLSGKMGLGAISMVKLVDAANEEITLEEKALDMLSSCWQNYAKLRYFL